MTYTDSSTWVLAKAERKRRPLLIRFRQFAGDLPKSTYPNRISIIWKLAEPDETGLPGDEEFDRLASFEDRLMTAVEHDQQSIFTLVNSGNGEHEFVFYTTDVTGFNERLTRLTEESYPISVQHSADPNWTYFHDAIPENIRTAIKGE